ncbi:MAG TPA: medium chain dehydrogenase/reductase family protein [Planctomycetota bacterium]|nr:medium chain dehydrogenase/reductase family protein [Planctomycetota bacterium]
MLGVRKVTIGRPGGYDRLEIVDGADPTPGPGEVAINVLAAGVNFADCVIRMGLYESQKKLVGWPVTPGFEVSGRRIGGGAGEVLAVTRFGGYASRVVVKESQVFPLPPRLDLRQAAGFPVIFLTAYYALFELAHPRPGSTILVHSAAGGVGSAAVQLARILGARVVGVVGASHKVAAVKADVVIDKSTEDLWAAARRAAPGGYDVVLDANGAETLKQGYDHLAPTGRLVAYGFHSMLRTCADGRVRWLPLLRSYLKTPRFHPIRMVNENRSLLCFNLSYLFAKEDLLREAMGRLLGWLAEGRIDPPPVNAYPFADVARAHRDLESGRTVGKLVLTF